jgi:hypothetical protein
MAFCHSHISFVQKVVSIRNKIIGEEETCRLASRGPKKKRQSKGELIKNKKPLNFTHISPKKEKQLEIRTTRREVLMSQFDDDEEIKNL